MNALADLYDQESEMFQRVEGYYSRWHADRMRNMLDLPSLHARFTGPTSRKHYSRRDRRRRRWL